MITWNGTEIGVWHWWMAAMAAVWSIMPPIARLTGLAALGVLLGLIPANRLLSRLGLRRWWLAALFLPGVGPLLFMWLVAFSGVGQKDDPDAERAGDDLGLLPQQPG